MLKRPDTHLPLIKRVLGTDYLELQLARLAIEEVGPVGPDGDGPGGDGLGGPRCRVVVEMVDGRGERSPVEGEGCGVVDALFSGLLRRYAVEYQSLRSIELVDFAVTANMETKHERSGVDALGTVTVEVKNSEGNRFSFSDDSRSITSSTARAVLAAVEYFINAERAFITLHKARKDAQHRGRHDLVARYTQEMAEVVQSTSYAEVIERIKQELG